jgi:YVTN family beta-propeller protein
VIPVGMNPSFVAASPNGAFLYVTNRTSHTVSVIETSTRTVIRNPITFGYGPFGVAMTPSGGHVYVSNVRYYGSGVVSVIDTTLNSVATTIPFSKSVGGVAVAPGGGQVYVTNPGEGTVSVIDTSTNGVLPATIPVGVYPGFVAVAPDGGQVYVTNGASNTVSVIDTATNAVVTTIPVGSSPAGIAIAPDGGFVYVTNVGSNTVSVIQRETPSIAPGPVDHDVVRGGSGDDTTINVVATIPVGSRPWGVAVTPDGSHVFVTNTAETTQDSPTANTVSVIARANHSVVTTLPPASKRPMGVVATAHNVYVAHVGSDTVSVIDV